MTWQQAVEALVNKQTLSGRDAKMVLDLLQGPERWRLAVRLALEYLNRDDIEMAKRVLEEVLDA